MMKQNNLNKKNISNFLSKKKDNSLLFSKKIIQDLIEILINEMRKNTVYLKNIGTFKVIVKKERFGRNPKTNKPHIIKARNSLTFKSSINLYKELNEYNEKVN